MLLLLLHAICFQPFLCSGSSEWLPETVFSLIQLSDQTMVAQTAEDISLVSCSLFHMLLPLFRPNLKLFCVL
jgi:hypothetical protein